MKAPGFLHEHEGFLLLIEQIADARNIEAHLIEKDYWLMHCLWGLQQQGWKFELKGGTSLSKGFQLIQRFSEDIDIRFEPPAEMGVKAGKNHDKPAHQASRRDFFDWLAAEINIPGLKSVTRDTDFDDAKYRNCGILLGYPIKTRSLHGVKDGILLEVGFDDTAPNTPCTISSWAMDAALNAKVAIIDNRAMGVACYSPAYTFVEKLQTVSTKFRMQQESNTFPKNFMRHYYDLYCLLDSPEVMSFIGTPTYQARKIERFRSGDNLDIASNSISN
ncbi:MAG: nucleotidyl transferase AbiEii/AbiGii toxin family protein [Gallionella sp.]